ncbi:MAG: hypothetical protein AABZ06_07665 [Bdellovibrionota bacterium]
MLQRIADVISEFIAPVSATNKGLATNREGKVLPFRQKEKNNPDTNAKAVAIAPKPPQSEPKPAGTPSVSFLFIQLLASLIKTRESSWFKKAGSKNYEQMSKKKRLTRLFKKGSILDEKAE